MFEVVTEKEFKEASSIAHPLDVALGATGEDVTVTADTSSPGKIYCEFCKGWYYEEYHYGDRS